MIRGSTLLTAVGGIDYAIDYAIDYGSGTLLTTADGVALRHWSGPPGCRCRAKMGQVEMFHGLSPESQDQILVLTVLYAPQSDLDCLICATLWS